MHTPLIGITTSAAVDRSPQRLYVNSAYVAAVQDAGGAPVLLPPTLSPRSRDALWQRLDGLLLTGGGDVEPARFGQASHPTTAEVSPARDALECELVERAVAEEVPVLGICRGLQVINVALGGSLCQDIASLRGVTVTHAQTAPRQEATHAVKVRAEETRLGGIVGRAALDVNSFHHQAVERLGRGLRETAWAPDGVIEGLETESTDSFLVAVQWHPEDLAERDPAARALFAALVEAARQQPRVRARRS